MRETDPPPDEAGTVTTTDVDAPGQESPVADHRPEPAAAPEPAPDDGWVDA